MNKKSCKKIMSVILTLALVLCVFASCTEKEEKDPLLQLWEDFVVEGTLTVRRISVSRGSWSSSIPAPIINESEIQTVISYLQDCNFSFVGIRDMDEDTDMMNAYAIVSIAHEVEGNETFLDCSLKKDGTFVIQDRERFVEFYTEAGAANYDAFWAMLNEYTKWD